MLPGRQPTPAQVIGELLLRHPEAASLQAEASHCRALARSSGAHASHASDAAQAARFGYEELRHRLDPRRVRVVGFGAGLLVLIPVGAGLGLFDYAELGGVLSPVGSALSALAATVVWLAGAWVAALAGREHQWRVCLAAGAAGVLLGLLLAALRGFGGHHVVSGILVSAFILVLAAAAAVLIARMEPWSLFAARRCWHQARAAHRAAARIGQDDLEAATIATESWLGLIRAQASMLAGDERLVQETVALAVDLLESGQSQAGIQRITAHRGP